MRASKTLLVAAAAAWLVSMNAVAQSQDYPDLLGTWKGTSEGVLLGSYLHASGNPNEPQPVSVDLTLTLTGQDGRRFWGTVASESASEPWLGVIRGDGKSLLGVDSDGYITGEIEDQDTIELCYVQTGEGIVAACTVFRRE